MRVLITFKVGGDNNQVHTRHYDFEPVEYELVKSDFLAYLNGGASALRGASYKCIDPDNGQVHDLLLRFDDILYVECIGQEEYKTVPKALSTGPLSARIASANGIDAING